ncbi:MAG: type II toxin-antitoxin system VapC family toxin [Pseudonocardia sp.]
MIILDASVLIAHLDTNDAHHDRADQLLAEHALTAFGASVMTRAEVLVGPSRHGRRRAIEDALDRLEIHTYAIPDDAAGQLAELRATTRLPLPDCCVLLTAESTGALEIATFDQKLAKVAAGRGVTVHGTDQLSEGRPDNPGDGPSGERTRPLP